MTTSRAVKISGALGLALRLCGLGLGLAVPAYAYAACETSAQQAHVATEIVDGRTLRIEDGSEVRLLGALPPQIPTWWKAGEPWPPAAAARRALEALVASSKIELRFAEGEARHDRHDRLLAHVFVLRGDERIWVQGHLIASGQARAVSFAGHRACARDLQNIEKHARASRAGLWETGEFTAMKADDVERLAKKRSSYQLVEGVVRSVGMARQWTFLNFTDDWRSDFTVAIAAKDRRRFSGSDIDLEHLEGKSIRVRGWLERWNGPVIKVTHPEQIEVLDGEGRDPASVNQGTIVTVK